MKDEELSQIEAFHRMADSIELDSCPQSPLPSLMLHKVPFVFLLS